MYRQINLSTPFPNRAPGENWQGKESLITSTKGDMPNKTLYEIKLTPEVIDRIKDYNDNHKYDNYDFENGKSKFIGDSEYGITRK
jgi:Golgi nucleoside diphosphatase